MDRRLRTKYKQFDEHGNVICYTCKDYFPSCRFDINKTNWFRQELDRVCKSCKKLAYERRRKNRRGENLKKAILERWHGAKDRAKKKNLPFSISRDFVENLWVEQEGKCAISGIEMTYTMFSGRVPTNLSIDQISPNKGYTEGNIQLVCSAINQMKNDMSEEELFMFCLRVVENAAKWKKK